MSTLDLYPTLESSSTRLGQPEQDLYDQPLTDASPIWTVYANASKAEDDGLIEQWNRGLDTLALFAGLFSAVTGAFIIESLALMQPDYTELTFRAISANLSGNAFSEPPFVIPRLSRAVNAVWLTSLLLSLSAALVAIMGKDWIAEYATPDRPNVREWAQLRQFRRDAVRHWRMPEIIAFAPILLHVSLLLFACGLALFLYPIDTFTSYLVIGLSTAAAAFYGVTSCSPFFYFSSPFRSPSMYAARSIFHGSTSSIVVMLRTVYWLITLKGQFFYTSVRATLEHQTIRADFASFRTSSMAQRTADTWSLVSAHANTFPSYLRARTVSIIYSLRLWWWSEPLDLWYHLSPRYSLERTAADVIAWLSMTSPTFDTFAAAVHVFKDAERGAEISSLVSPGVKTWFGNMVNLWNPGRGKPIESARTCIAALNLGLSETSWFSDVSDHCLSGDFSHGLPVDVLVFYAMHGIFTDPSHVALGNIHMDDARMMFILNSIPTNEHIMTRAQQLATLFALLNGFYFITYDDILAGILASVLRPHPHDLAWLPRTADDERECQRHRPFSIVMNYLCVYLRDPQKHGLSDDDIGRALSALITMTNIHACNGGHSALARLFAQTDSTHVMWARHLWTNEDISAVLHCMPRSSLSNGATLSKQDYAVDFDVAQVIARLLKASQRLEFPAPSNYSETSSKSTILLSRFIPPQAPSPSPEMRQYTYQLLNTALSGNVLYLIVQDDTRQLLSDIAGFLATEPDPYCMDAVTLFNVLIGEQNAHEKAEGARWTLARFLIENMSMPPSNTQAVEKLENVRALLGHLSLLRHVYDYHHRWSELASDLYSAVMERSLTMTSGEKDIYLAFCHSIGSVVS